MAPPARAGTARACWSPATTCRPIVDPHQIFDVPMQLYSLNTYDNLYRYQGNPPKLEPWLAQIAHRLGRTA